MVNPESLWIVGFLDEVDFDADPAREAAALQARLPELREALRTATTWVAESLAPMGPNHPNLDDWDDDVWMVRAMGQVRYGDKQRAVEEAEARLEEIVRSDDPARKVAGFLLVEVQRHLQSLGLGSVAARQASTPKAVGGIALAEVLWQARNQDQHYNESGNLHPPLLACFRVIVGSHPSGFGQSQPPTDDAALQRLLRQRSWAPEVLKLLEWTSSAAAVTGIKSIRP